MRVPHDIVGLVIDSIDECIKLLLFDYTKWKVVVYNKPKNYLLDSV